MESVKSFNPPFIDGVEIISGHNIINNFRRHIHKTYIIGLVKKGKRNITHPGGIAQISENEIFILNPGQVHSCSSEKNSEHSYKILSLAPVTIQTIASQISAKPEKRPYFKKIHYTDTELTEKFIQLFNTIYKPESDIQVESCIYSFIAFLLINFSQSPPLVHKTERQKNSIKKVCDYISQHYQENMSLKELAKISCLSPFHFQREFKKQMGITPHEYLSDFRISSAKKILYESDDIADIAIQTGFFDQSHFSRVFRKTVGIPPGKYCKINKIKGKKPDI